MDLEQYPECFPIILNSSLVHYVKLDSLKFKYETQFMSAFI